MATPEVRPTLPPPDVLLMVTNIKKYATFVILTLCEVKQRTLCLASGSLILDTRNIVFIYLMFI